MKNEMDLTRMDERQRLGWLLANRATLFIVGLCWLAMIAWELIHQRLPLFLVVMVPVFAAVRFVVFMLYTRKGVGS